MTDKPRQLLRLLEAWTLDAPNAPFMGWVTFGVRTQDGFRYWSFEKGPRGARCWMEEAPPAGAEVRLCLTRWDIDRLLAGRAPKDDSRRRLLGDGAVLRSFVACYVRQMDLLGVMCA